MNKAFLGIIAAGSKMGIPAAVVRGAQLVQPVFPVVDSKKYLAGVVNIRGCILPAFDVGVALGLSEDKPGYGCHILVRVDKDDFVILAEKAEDFLSVEDFRMEKASTTLPPLWRPAVDYIYCAEKGVVPVLSEEWLRQLKNGELSS